MDTNQDNGRVSPCRFINERIGEIRFSKEVLDKGLSELEVSYLRLQSGKVQDKQKIKENIAILSGQNDALAKAIKSNLNEVDSSLREYVQGGLALNMGTIHAYSDILHECISVLKTYEIVHENYNMKKSANVSTPTSGKRGTGQRRHKAPILQRIIQTICICGI